MFITEKEAHEKLQHLTEEDSKQAVRDSLWEVKAVKTFRGMEGTGFNANLYLKGKKVATVDDSAHGGCLDFNWLDKVFETELINFAHTLGEPSRFAIPGDDKTYIQWDLDYVVNVLITDFLEQKDWKRRLKGKIFFRLKSQKPEECYSMNIPYSETEARRLREKYGDELDLIFNEKYK